VNPEDLRYRLRVIKPNPKADLYLDDVILSFNMEESDDLWARRLTASVENVKHRDKRIAQLLMNGARV
jgi:hypothetical protein